MSRATEIFSRIEVGGEATIHAFVQDRKSEELFLDFKRSADNGAGVRLHDNDRKNLAKAISGFGNSEGGVIVWGVALLSWLLGSLFAMRIGLAFGPLIEESI